MRYLGLTAGLIAACIPSEANAIVLSPSNACVSSQGINCYADPGVPISGLTAAAITAFGGFLFAMFVFYGIKLLVSTSDENAQSETRKAIAFAIFGAALVAGSKIIAGSFTGWGSITNGAALETGILLPAKNFIVGLVGIALIVTITFQGIRLIISQDESQSSAARKRFIEGLIGAVVITLLDTIVDALLPGTGMGKVSSEIAGIGKFLATAFGFLSVVAIIVGGIMLVVSVNDDLKERGKKLITAGLISLIVVWMSYAIVHAFIA